MARIPIAQIPNAAPNIGQPSLLSPGVANLSGSSAALNRAAGQMQQSPININAFGAEGAGIASIGNALAGASGRGANIIADVQNRINRAKDNADLARADVLMRETFAQHRQDMEGVPETEWVQRWQEKTIPKLQRDIDALGLSPNAAKQLEPSFIRYQSDAGVKLQTEAWKRTAANSRDALLLAAEKSFRDGDFESSEGYLNKAVEDNLITRTDADKMLMKMEEDQRTQEIHTAVSQDPFGVEADMAEALKKDGKSEFFPWVNRPEQLRRIQSMAKQEAGRVRRDEFQQLDDGILNGTIESEEEIRERTAAVGASERDTRSLLQSLYVEKSNTPEGQAKYLGNFNEVRSEVVNYDPKTDREDENYYSILRRIRSEVIPGEREALLTDLRERRRDGLKPSDQIRRSLTNTVTEMRKAGLLGEVVELEKDRKGRAKNSEAHFESLMAVSQKEGELLDEVQRMVKENPGISHEEASQRFRDIVGRPVADQAAAIFDQQQEAAARTFSPVRQGSWVSPMPMPEKKTESTPPTSSTMKTNPIQQIVNLEARRDSQGRLSVYSLPSGDGGGSFEIAGINDRYHPGMAKRLRQLINAGQHGQAETEAGNYIKQYTDPVAKHATNPGVEFALRDTAFNRGPTGAARILQKALGVKVDGKIGPVTREALAKAEQNPKQFLQDFRQAREWYERTYARRSPGNKFWNGLVNRWNKQTDIALQLA